jgi:hypothetical protein
LIKISYRRRFLKKSNLAGCWWLIPVILAIQEAEIRRIAVQSQLWTISSRDPILKNSSQNKGWVE